MPPDDPKPERACPDDATVDRLMSGTLDPAAREALVEHSADCEACCDLFAALAPPTAADAVETQEEVAAAGGEGFTIDRYRILETLGSGGMGIVYCAYDVQLDRKVALKVLRERLSERVDEGGRNVAGGSEAERLLREARAMAKLSHPNVVRVFDVGVSDGRVFVAMELVEHGTLRAWLEQKKRPWREILGLFRQAGEGLAAAHRVGLVHRDFKPENLLVRDGTVLVTDFGLARATNADAKGAPSSNTAAYAGPRLLAWDATNVAGTPVYMAPEQLTGETLDARADVFAFSVSLWEALYGGRPFSPDGPGGLLGSIADGPRTPKHDPGVPVSVKKALTKGMAYHRRDRPRSIEDLSRDLTVADADKAAWYREPRTAVAFALALALALAVVAGVRSYPSGPALVLPREADTVERGDVSNEAGLGERPSVPDRDAALASLVPSATPAGSRAHPSAPSSVSPPASSTADAAPPPGASAGGARIRSRSTGFSLEPFGMKASPLLDTFRHGFDGCFPSACVALVKPDEPKSGSSYCRVHLDAAGHVTGGSCKSFEGQREVSCHAFERCVVARVKSFSLPRPENGAGDVTMNFVFVEK